MINSDSILVYGNIGIWVTDSTFKEYRSLNAGFPKGADNRKIFDIHRTRNGELYAATQFGLFSFDAEKFAWHKFNLDTKIKRFVGIESIGDTLYVLNRSYLFKGKSKGINTHFQKIELQQPDGYRNDVSLLQTIWQIHSGEIFGLPGQLFVDLLGLITIFLSATGIIYFFFPGWIKKRKRKAKGVQKQVRINRWSLKWHNKTGAWLFIFLIVLFFSGMFLRPPLLIAIANSRVTPIKYSHLDQPNPWYDKLRDILYDANNNRLILSTSEGMFYLEGRSTKPEPFINQPPISVMGINVLENIGNGSFLVGSFTGLFIWHPNYHGVIDVTTGQPYIGSSGRRPVGTYKVAGVLSGTNGEKYMIDYDRGVVPLGTNREFPSMPQNILKASPMPLWNLSLEIHTGRFFRFLLHDFYILIVPLSSLISVMVVLSGYLFYRKKFKKKTK